MRYETLSHLFLTRLIYTLQEKSIKTVHPILYRSALLAHRQKGQLLRVINNPKQKTIFYFVFQPGTTCSQCNTHNVLPCGQRKEICSTDTVCRFHSTQATKYKQCQQNVCHRMYEKIRKHHISNKPSLEHTDATKWCTDGWEIAKCYFKSGNNQTGDSDTTSATEMTGLLKLIKNCKFFGRRIGANWHKIKHVSSFILSFN